MKKVVVVIAFMCLQFACKQHVEQPNNLLSEEKMIEVIVDVQLAETIVKLRLNQKDSIAPEMFYQSVYDKHDITGEVFNENLKFYAQQPEKLETFYTEAINQLSEKQAQIQGKQN